MELSTLLTEDRAVSPVIGVILMVAITVILAAVIGTFVLGLGQNVQSTPSASFDFDFDSEDTNVNVTHNGGDSLTLNENTGAVLMSGGSDTEDWVSPGNNTEITAGDQFPNYGYDDDGDTIRVVWQGTSNESSATLAQQDAPA